MATGCPCRADDVTNQPAGGGRSQGFKEREVTLCRMTDGQPDVCVAGPPEKVVEKVEVLDSFAYHALWS